MYRLKSNLPILCKRCYSNVATTKFVSSFQDQIIKSQIGLQSGVWFLQHELNWDATVSLRMEETVIVNTENAASQVFKK